MLNATLKRSLILWAVATAMVASLGLAAGAQTAARQDPGALISMTLKGTVGVLLDEVPPGQWRETAAQNALQKKGSDPFWVERAKRQVRLTFYRLVFRGFYYPPGKGPLPLPPKSGGKLCSTAAHAAAILTAMTLSSKITPFAA